MKNYEMKISHSNEALEALSSELSSLLAYQDSNLNALFSKNVTNFDKFRGMGITFLKTDFLIY
jgi:hypothetical protein